MEVRLYKAYRKEINKIYGVLDEINDLEDNKVDEEDGGGKRVF